MTVCTPDHRCSCVQLREVDQLLTEAQECVREATAALEDPDPSNACRAVELLRTAGLKRTLAATVVRNALAAMEVEFDQTKDDAEPIATTWGRAKGMTG